MTSEGEEIPPLSTDTVTDHSTASGTLPASSDMGLVSHFTAIAAVVPLCHSRMGKAVSQESVSQSWMGPIQMTAFSHFHDIFKYLSISEVFAPPLNLIKICQCMNRLLQRKQAESAESNHISLVF